MSRFDPLPDQPYGKCADCGVTLPTGAAADEHMNATMATGNSSHRVRITNAPRGDRIRRAVANVIDDAITEALPDLDRLVERDGATAAEVADALNVYPDFADAYAEWVESA